jgi:hypothetical protein
MEIALRETTSTESTKSTAGQNFAQSACMSVQSVREYDYLSDDGQTHNSTTRNRRLYFWRQQNGDPPLRMTVTPELETPRVLFEASLHSPPHPSRSAVF